MSSENNPKDLFFSRLEDAIKAKGLTKKAFAEQIGIAPQALTKYANGRLPGGEILARMAGSLGVSSDFLLGISQMDYNDELQMRAEEAERKLQVLKRVYALISEAHQEIAKIL